MSEETKESRSSGRCECMGTFSFITSGAEIFGNSSDISDRSKRLNVNLRSGTEVDDNTSGAEQMQERQRAKRRRIRGS